MSGEAGALAADRILENLHHDVLLLVKEDADVRVRAPSARSVARDAGSSVAAATRNRRFRVAAAVRDRHVRSVKECGPIQPDVDEGGLHTGQDAADAPLVDVADEPAPIGPLDEDLLEHAVLHHRDPGLSGRDVEQELDAHGSRRSPRGAGGQHGRPIRTILELADFTSKVAAPGESGATHRAV